MKKTFLSLTILIFSFLGYTQNIKLNNDELRKILCQNWRIDSVIINGEKASLPESFLNSGMEFKLDNTFTERPITEKSESGEWKYNIEKHCIELFNNEKLIGTIKSVSSEELLYFPFLAEDSKMFIKTSEMHLKPF